MKNPIQDDNIKTWKTWILFVASGILLVLSLPRNSTFHYEFQTGKEWLSDEIISPIDFPIYKTAEELSADRKKILDTYKPYFQYNTIVEQQQINAFSALLDKNLDDQYYHEKNTLLNLLRDVYQRCILQKNDIPQEFANRQQLVISVVKNNISQDYPLAEIFTPDDACKYIYSNFLLQNKSFMRQQVFARINIRDYVKSNIVYDEIITGKVKEQLLEDISPSKGIVTAGTKLIAKGEFITSKNIQILESFKREYKKSTGFTGNFWLLLTGQILFVIICLLQLYLTLKWYQPIVFKRLQNLIFILLLITLAVFFSMQVVKASANIYLVPLAIVPIYISAFIRSRAAMYVYISIITLVFFYAPNSFEFAFISLTVGIVSVSEFRTWYRRGRLFISIGQIFLAYVLSYVTVCLIKDGSMTNFDFNILLSFGFNAIFVLFAYQLIYIFEKIFGFISNNTLMELADTNRTLLRQLAEKAPGTFHHSMQVANLAEEVVRQINGDTLLIRVGALYHDIGKTLNPEYFIENQQHGYSIHQDMQPNESAQIIIKHVENGVALAKKHNLHTDIIDFIRMHHAKSTVRYFLSKYKEQHPDATDFSAFSYPGPNPSSKELAVLMMADSIEAASRTLPSYTEETISNLVEDIVNAQIAEGYMNAANITLKELSQAKEIFKTKLKNIYHARITYPK
jgi:putative nucleotidyltransferase with HDIG domain